MPTVIRRDPAFGSKSWPAQDAAQPGVLGMRQFPRACPTPSPLQRPTETYNVAVGFAQAVEMLIV